jgi:hypothetical protein
MHNWLGRREAIKTALQINIFLLILFNTTTKYQTPSAKLFVQTFAHPLKHPDLNADVWYELSE